MIASQVRGFVAAFATDRHRLQVERCRSERGQNNRANAAGRSNRVPCRGWALSRNGTRRPVGRARSSSSRPAAARSRSVANQFGQIGFVHVWMSSRIIPAAQPSRGGSRMGSRGGMSGFTPPRGANRARMARARLAGDRCSVSAARRDRPCFLLHGVAVLGCLDAQAALQVIAEVAEL